MSSYGLLVVFLMTRYFGVPSGAGTYGDMFGAINALFSGLAFAGVIVAIFLQRKELELQREELTATREELAKTARANREQAEIQNLAAQIAGLNSLIESGNSWILSKPGYSTTNPDLRKMNNNILNYEAEVREKIKRLTQITVLSKMNQTE